MKTVNIYITLDDNSEYRVPAPDGREAGAYYTDDKEDAVGTARLLYKDLPGEYVFRTRRVAEHPEGK